MRSLHFFILLFFSCLSIPTFASEVSSFSTWTELSIKELSENIEKLKDEKMELTNKTKELSWEYWELISFIKWDLSEDEISEIKTSINFFIEKRNSLQDLMKEKVKNNLDVEEEKKELVLLRADIYKYLAKYVAFEKRSNFLEHIKIQVQSEKESKDLIEEILKNQNVLNNKVQHIKAQIKDHKEWLKIRIENSITQKIKTRIDEIDNNPKYKFIQQETKNQIYTNFLTKISAIQQEVKNSNLSENYKEMKQTILQKMYEEIQEKIK